jgi:phosphate transport system substrate-binding protein
MRDTRPNAMMAISNACDRRFFATVLVFLGLVASATAHAETLRVGGTGAGLGTMRALAAEFSKTAGITVVVVPNLGSRGGFKALAEGAIDMAVASRPLNPEETQQGLVAVEYGKTPFVIATSKKGAPGLKDLDELADIYAGRRSAWPDGEPIRLVMRPPKDGDSTLLTSFSPEMKLAVEGALARPGMIIASTDQDAANAIEHTPGALGTASLALIYSEKRDLKVLPLNGVTPSAKTAADGSYPYSKAMYLVRKTGGKESVARFFEFMSSGRARQILIDSGHWLANAKTER